MSSPVVLFPPLCPPLHHRILVQLDCLSINPFEAPLCHTHRLLIIATSLFPSSISSSVVVFASSLVAFARVLVEFGGNSQVWR